MLAAIQGKHCQPRRRLHFHNKNMDNCSAIAYIKILTS